MPRPHPPRRRPRRAFFFPEHGAHGCDDFGTLTMTDADGRVATLCGGRIGTASHPQGGPSRAYLIGTRQSATIGR